MNAVIGRSNELRNTGGQLAYEILTLNKGKRVTY